MRNVTHDKENKSAADDLATVVMDDGNGAETGIFSRDLMTGLMGMVPILGNAKVAVGFAGENAFCDPTLSYVNIPALPPADVIPLHIAREIRGFAAHEAAHIAFTDNDIFPSRIIDTNGNHDPLLKEIWNCVEDFMIEKHWIALYPGARKNFAATEARCCRGYLESHAKTPDMAKDLRQVGPVALTWMRSLYFNLGVSASRECLQTISNTLRQRIVGWFQDIEDVETTEECLEAARRIHADIQANPFDPADPPASQAQNSPPQTAGQNGQGAQGGQSGQSGGAQGGQSGQSGGAQGGQSGQSGGAQGGHGGQSGQGGQSGGTQDDTDDAGNGDQDAGPQSGGIKGPGNSTGAPTPGGGAAPTPYPTSMNIDHVLSEAGKISDDPNWVSTGIFSSNTTGPHADALGNHEGRKTSDDAQGRIRGTISATSNQLRRALKSVAKDRWKGGRTDGHIDHRRIASAVSGGVDYHKRKVEGEKVDTAVSILVDTSGSMSGSEIAICQDLALILEQCFAGTPIKHEIIGFTTGSIENSDTAFQTMIKAHEKRGDPIQARAINLYEFRHFDQSTGSALKTIGNMREVPMGGTPTSDAILITHDRLARRKERRHVMFVLTDGAPDDLAATQNAVKAVESCGVTVVGIGIGSDTVDTLFSNAVSLGDARDLPSLMMSRLSKILLGDKAKTALNGRAAEKMRTT